MSIGKQCFVSIVAVAMVALCAAAQESERAALLTKRTWCSYSRWAAKTHRGSGGCRARDAQPLSDLRHRSSGQRLSSGADRIRGRRVRHLSRGLSGRFHRQTGAVRARVAFNYLGAWISWRLHTRIGSTRLLATAWTAALAPLIVVMHGTRHVTAARRIAFSSVKVWPPVVV